MDSNIQSEAEFGMKRISDYTFDVNQHIKKPKLEQNTRLLLVGRYCGLIVGKKGENLGRLRNEYSVRLEMPASRTDDRIFSIVGDVDSCAGVVKEILPSCHHAPFPVGQKCQFEINLLVATEVVGMVIGKGGDKLKEIRDESNGRIKVYQECLPGSNERVVAVGGEEEEDVIGALKMILNILKDARKAPFIPYDPNNKPTEMIGGSLSGSGMSLPILNQFVGGMTHEPALPVSNDIFQQLPTSTSITVPNELCGAIIGKAGVIIKEIRRSSGALIEFSQTEEGRVVTIVGTQYQVNLAERLMGECLRNRTTSI